MKGAIVKVHGGQAGILATAAVTAIAGRTGDVEPFIDPAVGNWIMLLLTFLAGVLPQLIRREPMK